MKKAIAMKKDIMMLFECNGLSYIFTKSEFWIRLFGLLSFEENSEFCIEMLSDLEVSFHE